MIVAGLFFQCLLAFSLLLNELMFNRCRNFATVIFLVLYTLLFVLVPLALHVFFDGARSIVAGNEGFFQDDFVYQVLNVYGIVFLGSTAFSAFFRSKARGVVLGGGGEEKQPILFVSGTLVAGFFVFLYSTGMSIEELLVASRFSWFQNSNAWTPGIAISHYFFSLTPVLAYYFALDEKNAKKIFVFVVALLFVVFYGVLSQDRKWVFYLFSGVVAAVYERGGRSLEIKAKHLTVSVSLFLVLIISQFIRDYFARYMVGQTETDGGFWRELNDWWGFLIEKGDLSYFYRASLEAVNYTLSNGVLVPGGVIRRNMLFFLPVGMSGGLKPEDLSAVFSDVVGGEDETRRGNMPPGFFGLFAISFGIPFSIFFVAMMPWLIKMADNVMLLSQGLFRDVLLASYLSLVLLLLRGDDSSAVYFLIFGCMVCYMFSVFNKVLTKVLNG